MDLNDVDATILGMTIRGLREGLTPSMTQEQLGRAAGYGAGARVSISRIETGVTRPARARLAGIARALDLTPDQLIDLAMAQPRASSPPEGDTSHRGRSRAIRERLSQVQKRIDARTETATALGTRFNLEHEHARDEFFNRFISIAGTIEGAPRPDTPMPPTQEPSRAGDGAEPRAGSAETLALDFLSSRIATALAGGLGGAAAGAGLGGAAAYATFTAATIFGSASTGAAISGLTGIAATNATLALLGGGTLAAGGAGIAGGTLLLTGIVAAPVAVLTAGGLLLLTRRRSQKEDERLSTQLTQAENDLNSTQAGFDALADTLSEASDILDYIGVHASHALTKWEQTLGPSPRAWSGMTPEQQQRYQGFVTVAACQITVDCVNPSLFMTTHGDDLASLTAAVERSLSHAKRTVKGLV